MTDHWASTVAASGLPADKPGLDVAVAAPDVARALRAVVNQADAQAEATRRNKERRQQKRAAKTSR